MTFRQFLANEMNNVLYSYSSTHIDLPDQLADEIIKWGSKIPDKLIFTDPKDPSFGRENEIHCTVLYGLHTEKPADVEKLLKDEAPFSITLGKTSLFTTNDKFDVLKLDVKSRHLHALNKKLSSNLKVTNSYSVYCPHVTIAYIKKGKATPYVNNDKFVGEKILVDKIVFSSNTGKKILIPLAI